LKQQDQLKTHFSFQDRQEQEHNNNNIMMVVAKELFLDLTDHADPRELLLQARRTSLGGDIQELTLISNLDKAFCARELGQILRQASHLSAISLFSVALTGTGLDFAELADALKRHRGLKEVHLVDCGMSLVDAATAAATCGSNNYNYNKVQVPPTVQPLPPGTRPMDAFLLALAQIPTLENVEIYALPAVGGDDSEDDDEDIVSASNNSNNNNSNGIVRVASAAMEDDDDVEDLPMFEESLTCDDEDEDDDDYFMDDDDRDIRGIPSSRHGRFTNQTLNLLMSPTSIASLCTVSPSTALTNLSLEDMTLQDDHLAQMANALMTNNVMKSLKLWGCNIRDSGCNYLARMLEVNKTLEKLDLSNNRIEDDGCVAIAVSLRFNISLRWLCLVGNDCTAANHESNSDGRCYEALLALLQQNSILEDLILEPHETPVENGLPATIFVPVAE
jgi:hypothetical protein